MIVEVTFSPEKRREISLKSLTEVNITYKKDHTTRNGTDIFLFKFKDLLSVKVVSFVANSPFHG